MKAVAKREKLFVTDWNAKERVTEENERWNHRGIRTIRGAGRSVGDFYCRP